MLNGLSTRLKAILGVQFVLAFLFFAMAWSQTSSLMFGRTPSFADIVALAAPLALVIVGAVACVAATRRGRRELALSFALVPIPLAIVLAMLAGMV